MDDLENKLDRLCLELLETLAEIDHKKRTQENQLKDGYLYLAKARYVLGIDRVSKLYYAATMKPRLTVLYSEDSSDKFSFLPVGQPTENNKIENGVPRKRNVPNNSQDSNQEACLKSNVLENGQNNPEDEKKFVEKPIVDFDDPIRWFGVFVPQALRHAQSSFMQAIQTSCGICSLQLKLDETRLEYLEARKLQALNDKKLLCEENHDVSNLKCEDPDK